MRIFLKFTVLFLAIGCSGTPEEEEGTVSNSGPPKYVSSDNQLRASLDCVKLEESFKLVLTRKEPNLSTKAGNYTIPISSWELSKDDIASAREYDPHQAEPNAVNMFLAWNRCNQGTFYDGRNVNGTQINGLNREKVQNALWFIHESQVKLNEGLATCGIKTPGKKGLSVYNFESVNNCAKKVEAVETESLQEKLRIHLDSIINDIKNRDNEASDSIKNQKNEAPEDGRT